MNGLMLISPNITFYLPVHLRSQLYKAGKRSKNEEPAGSYAHQIFDRLLIDLSYNSSRLEGNTYSLLDTERLILEGTGVEGKLDEEKVMILNHKEAIRYLVDSTSRLKVSKQIICTLHYLLSDGLVEARYAGKIRDHAVPIGGSTYIPFEDSDRLHLQLERIVEKAALIENPYEQSLFLLVHISYLQAFEDVNKRTARLCANIPLITKNLVPLSFNDIEKEDYISAMIAIYELQDVRSLVDLYVFSYLRTCAMYDTTIKAIGFDEIRVRYRQMRRALIRDIIMGKLVGNRLMVYIDSHINKMIPEKDRNAFLKDVMEDLQEMDQSRIVVLGITSKELEDWLKIYRSK
jgi:fido (protein-threonine AMPylation protein)